MAATAVKFTKTIWNKGKFLKIGILLFVLSGACHGYDMENYCNKELSFITKFVDQIKLELNDNRIYDNIGDGKRYCETTFETWSTRYRNFMFYFEHLDLDCDKGYLEFYLNHIGQDMDRRVPGLETEICGNAKPEGVFTVDNQYFRIKYVPRRSQYISDIFSMIITAYDDADSCESNAFKCDNSRCINEDLACNGYDSCGDGSGCDLRTGVIVGIVIGCVVGVGLIISLVICCICWKRRSGRTPGTIQTTATPAATYTSQTQQVYSPPMYGVNQGSPYNPSQPAYPVATTGIATTPSTQ